jgi:hypothetical protein
MVEIFRFIGYFLERCERENSRIFWFVAILLALTFSSFDDRSLIRFQTIQTPAVIKKNVKNVLAINSGGDGTVPKSDNFVFQTGLRKRKKFDIIFHHRLEQHFPDWGDRMACQKKQEEFYKLAMKKKKGNQKIKNERKF